MVRPIFPCIRWLGLYPRPTSELPCLFPAYLSVLADFSPTPEQIICQRVFLTSQTAWSLCPGRRVFLLEPEPCCWPFIGLFSSIWKRVSWDALLRIGLKFPASENQAEKKEGGWIVMQRWKVGRPHRNYIAPVSIAPMVVHWYRTISPRFESWGSAGSMLASHPRGCLLDSFYIWKIFDNFFDFSKNSLR